MEVRIYIKTEPAGSSGAGIMLNSIRWLIFYCENQQKVGKLAHDSTHQPFFLALRLLEMLAPSSERFILATKAVGSSS